MRKNRFSQDGQSMAEFVLVFPILLLLVLGLLQLASIGFAALLCHQAAAHAARCFSVYEGDDPDQALELAALAADRILSHSIPRARTKVILEGNDQALIRPPFFKLRVDAELPLFFSPRPAWRGSITLSSLAQGFSEATSDYERWKKNPRP